MNPDAVLDTLARLTHAVSEDARLSAWLIGLSELPATQRAKDIVQMIEKMKSAGEDADLIAAIYLLSDERVLTGVCAALEIEKQAKK